MARLFATASPPTVADDPTPIVVGVEFEVSAEAVLSSILFFQPTTGTVSTAERTVALYEVLGAFSGIVHYTAPLAVSGPGWQTHTVTETLTLQPGTRYRAAVLHPAGGYVATENYFTTGAGAAGVTDGILSAPSAAAATDGAQGQYRAATEMEYPGSTWEGGNYWVDVEVGTPEPPAPIVGFAAHDGTSWRQGHGWAHDGTSWLPATGTGL